MTTPRVSASRVLPVLLDHLAVKLRDMRLTDATVADAGGELLSRNDAIRWVSVRIDHARAADLFLAYERHPNVEDVVFDETAQVNAVYATGFNDPLLGEEYHLHRMSVPSAWKHADGSGIIAAVVDSGMDVAARGQPEFAGKPMWHWNGYYNNDVYPDPFVEDTYYDATGNNERTRYYHGLACIGLLCGDGRNDARGPVGVAPGASLVNMANWDSSQNMPSAGCANGITQAVDRFGAKVISISLGYGGVGSPTLTGPIPDAIQYVKSRAIVFSSAGNNGYSFADNGYFQNPAYAAQYYGAGYSVGCTEPNLDVPTRYSNYGDEVNVATPGESVWTPYYHSEPGSPTWFWCPPNYFTGGSAFPTALDVNGVIRFRQFNGTSAACPVAAGVCALIWSANPALTADQVRAIYTACCDVPDNWLFRLRFPRAGTGVPNALWGVLKAKSTVTPGTVYPFVAFYGPGVTITYAGATPTTHLRGPLRINIDGCSTDPITSVELWSGARLIYSGPPRMSRAGTNLYVHAHHLVGGNLRVVAHTATTTAEETYTDVVAYAAPTGAVAPPRTYAVTPPGHYPEGNTITLAAESDAHPVRISYRWNTDPWQRYTGPIPVETGTLSFYGVDCLGNVEGGVDYDP